MISKNYPLLKWYNFFYDFRPYEAVAILYYAQVTGSYTLGFSIYSIASLASMAFEVPTGVFSDRVGRRKTVIYGSISSVLGIAFYAFAPSFAWLAVGAVFNGLTRALLSGNNDALLYDSLKQQGKSDKFAHAVGKVQSMFEIALAISALLGGLIGNINLRYAMIASILPQAICVLIALRFTEPKTHTEEISENAFDHLKEALRAFRRSVKLRKLSAAQILHYGFAESAYFLEPAFYALVWPTWALGIARSLKNALAFVGFHFAGKVIDRFGAFKSLLGQEILSLGNNLVFYGFPNVLSPIMLSINAFFYGIAETAQSDLQHKEFTDKQRATMGSLNSFGGSLCFALATFVMGASADAFGPRKTLLIAALIGIPVVLIYSNLFRQHNDALESQDP